jgi:hypothetical protein
MRFVAHRPRMLFDLQPPGALLLYPFRYRDPRTGNWIRTRYKAERHEIVERYAEWEITGPVEVRSGTGVVMFSPSSKLAPRAHLPIEEPPDGPPPEKPPDDNPPIEEPPPVEDLSALDQLERFLVLVFLRRYVTYCARRRRFAAMNARLNFSLKSESINGQCKANRRGKPRWIRAPDRDCSHY